MSNQPSDASREYLRFVQESARRMRSKDQAPNSLKEWQLKRKELRRRIIDSLGGFPTTDCELNPTIVGSFKRDGYRVERLLLQTRQGITMTANAYVPDQQGKLPAVLCVHGHWRLAKSEPVVQSRCIGLAKLGFFVLMVDAFGAGERGLGKALGEYHGEMVAGTLWPTGLALAGLQVYENHRAVDYIQSRPEVDPDRIGITGASGGGNQTMYAGALDERLKCVVPVCSVGTYQSYLGAACCMCEVTPGALSYTEESGVLSLVAPRGLMLINASRDAFQFSIGEGKKSLTAAKSVFRLYGKESNARQTTFESGHDYSRPMREAMYGWMTMHLKGHGDGSPIKEPEIKTEEAETLRCFPGNSRPNDFVTLPRFAAAEGRRILKNRPTPDHKESFGLESMLMASELPKVLGIPDMVNSPAKKLAANAVTRLQPEAGLNIAVKLSAPAKKSSGAVVLLDLDQGIAAESSDLAKSLLANNYQLATADLRATGQFAHKGDRIGRAPDHNTAEWSLWIGRPLLGGWVIDVKQIVKSLRLSGAKTVSVIGQGPAGLVALCAAALDPDISSVAVSGTLGSYITESPYQNQRLGTMVPGILERVGDIAHIASLIQPRPLLIARGVQGDGKAITAAKQEELFSWTRKAYAVHDASDNLKFTSTSDAETIAKQL